MQNRRILFFVGLLFALLPGCSFLQEEHKEVAQAVASLPAAKQQAVHTVTIFIHGTVMPYPSPQALGVVFKSMFSPEETDVSVYQSYLEHVKQEGVYRRQPINKQGLIAIDLDNKISKEEIGYCAQQTALLYKKVYETVNNDRADTHSFYTFGWSGRLSNKHRREAAQILYQAIVSLVQKLQKQTMLPIKIHILAHSHGGNVALYLHEVATEQKIFIDKLILFGTPVQQETEAFVTSERFGRVYHIFSYGDHVQIADLLSTKDFFSRRMFGEKKGIKKLPKHLYQLCVEAEKYKPYHWELWLWGDKHFPYLFYRKKFPLYPLPLSVFTPAIIKLVDGENVEVDEHRLLHIHIDSKQGCISLKGREKEVCQKLDIKSFAEQGCLVL